MVRGRAGAGVAAGIPADRRPAPPGPQPGGLPHHLCYSGEARAPAPCQSRQEPRAAPAHPQSVTEGWGPTAVLGASQDLGPPGLCLHPRDPSGPQCGGGRPCRCLPADVAEVSVTNACSGRLAVRLCWPLLTWHAGFPHGRPARSPAGSQQSSGAGQLRQQWGAEPHSCPWGAQGNPRATPCSGTAGKGVCTM